MNQPYALQTHPLSPFTGESTTASPSPLMGESIISSPSPLMGESTISSPSPLMGEGRGEGETTGTSIQRKQHGHQASVMNNAFAKTLRANATDAENRLWRRLRNRQLDDFKFRRQISLDSYIVDFVCFEARLIIEVDGGQHGDNVNYDEKRTLWLNAHGFEVLRFWNNEALNETQAVLEVVRCKLHERVCPPHPNPLPQGERGPNSPSPLMGESTTTSPSPLMGEGRGEGENKRIKQGFALVSSLVFLLVITLIGVSLFLGVNLQQKAAGNTLQKTRALQLANSVTLSAERWLAQTTSPDLYSCTTDATVFRVCALPPAKPSEPTQWGSGATSVNVQGLQVSTSGGVDSYYAQPAVWITYLGHATMGPGELYLINAYAWGGNDKSLVVTEAVFYVGGDTQRTTAAKNLGQ